MVATGFGLGSFSQVKTCGYLNLFRSLKAAATLMKAKLFQGELEETK